METKKNILDFAQKKARGEKISMLTAYDYPTALVVDRAGVDIVLVGDSVGNVVLGYDSTVPVTMDEMLHHTKAVRRGIRQAFLVADLPFMSFNIERAQTIANAGRIIKEGQAEAVKIEGGQPYIIGMIQAVIDAGIAVMGHIGLTPQTATQLGGCKVQGKTEAAAQRLIDEARALEQAGCFAVVLECIPGDLGRQITQAVRIPTIGIGAGAECDGQVLVVHDMLGLTPGFVPKFVKQYAQCAKDMEHAVKNFIADVQSGKFPDQQHSFSGPKQSG